MGDADMTRHLGGPEPHEKLVQRQAKYEGLAGSGTGHMFVIVDDETGDEIGSVGFWDKEWRGEKVYEIGWHVIPGYQGRGIASTATARSIELAAAEGKHRAICAFPSVDNLPSNGICRKLGFTLVEETEFEYPAGHFMTCNCWRLGLSGKS